MLSNAGTIFALLAMPHERWRVEANYRFDIVEALTILRGFTLFIAQEKVRERLTIGSYDGLSAYLRMRLGSETLENFRVLYLDATRTLIADELHNVGTGAEVGVNERRLLHRAKLLGATQIIAVHNHPAGGREPSRSDLYCTKQLLASCNQQGIEFLDHVIVTRTKIVSIRYDMGLW